MIAHSPEEITSALARLGLSPQLGWVKSTLASGFDRLNRSDVIERLLEIYLSTNIRITSSGTLPRNVLAMGKHILKGRHVVQLDEVVNVAAPVRKRYKKCADQCLKLKISDGSMTLIAIEYSPISFLSFNTPPGSKMIITDATVVNGTLLLAPQNVQLLGGEDPLLIPAFQAVVATCNATAQPYQAKTEKAAENLLARATTAAFAEYEKSLQTCARTSASCSLEVTATDASTNTHGYTEITGCGDRVVTAPESIDHVQHSEDCLNEFSHSLPHVMWQTTTAGMPGESFGTRQLGFKPASAVKTQRNPLNLVHSPHTPIEMTQEGSTKRAQASGLKRDNCKEQPTSIAPFLTTREVLSETAANARNPSKRTVPSVDESHCLSSLKGNADVIDLCESPGTVGKRAANENTYGERRFSFKRLRKADGRPVSEEGLDSSINLYDNDPDLADFLVDLTAAE